MTIILPVFSPRSTPRKASQVVLDALDDGLAVLELAPSDPAADLLDELGLEVVVVADDEAAQGQPLADEQVPRLRGPGAGSVAL